MGDEASRTTKYVDKFLPLLFYWKLHQRHVCLINPDKVMSNFNTTFRNYGATKQLEKKLNGQRLELRIDQMPTSFTVMDKEQLFFFILFAVSSDKVSFVPETTPLVVTYTLYRDNQPTKTGKIEVAILDETIPWGRFRVMRKVAWEYLESYDENTRRRAKDVVDQLLEEL